MGNLRQKLPRSACTLSALPPSSMSSAELVTLSERASLKATMSPSFAPHGVIDPRLRVPPTGTYYVPKLFGLAMSVGP